MAFIRRAWVVDLSAKNLLQTLFVLCQYVVCLHHDLFLLLCDKSREKSGSGTEKTMIFHQNACEMKK